MSDQPVKAPKDVRRLRELRGLTYAEVTARSGLSSDTITAIESGADIFPSTWRKYLAVLEAVPLSPVLGELEPAS